jgi:hypothetical protein
VKHYQKYLFGQLDGQDVEAYRLENDLGYQLSVMTYGATILEYVTPDKQDQFANIVLGFDNLMPMSAIALNMEPVLVQSLVESQVPALTSMGKPITWKPIMEPTATIVDRLDGTAPCLAWSR